MIHLFLYNQDQVFTQKRLVFASTPPGAPAGGGGSTPEGGLKPEDITLQNLREGIRALEKMGVANWLIEKALHYLSQFEKRSDDAAQNELLETTKKAMEAPDETRERLFDSSLNIIEGKSLERQGKTGEKAGAEAPKEQPGTPPTTIPVTEIQSEMSEKLAGALGSVEQALSTTEKAKPPNAQLIEKMKKLQSELKTLVELEAKSQKETKAVLAEAVLKRRLTEKEAKEILDLDPEDKDFETQLRDYLREMLAGSKADSDLANKVIVAKKREAKEFNRIIEDYGKKLGEIRETMSSLGDIIYQEAYRERAIREHSRSLGFELKEEKILRFKATRPIIEEKDGVKQVIGYEPIYRRATVKKITFEEIEMKTPDGKTKKVPSLIPSVHLEIEDEWPDSQGKKYSETETMNAAVLKDHMDRQEMVELIEDRQDTDETDKELSEVMNLIGLAELNVGSQFEYRNVTTTENGGVKGQDITVTVAGIHKEDDGYLTGKERRKHTLIELDHEVLVTGYPENQKKKVLTLGEFARWYKRANAVPPMKLEESREKLREIRNERNKKYGRSDAQYPPIEMTPGEVLYYDTGSLPIFVIKEVDPTGVTLENGSHYTPASFVQWVKNNEVEKKTAEAEAHKKTDHIEGEQEKQKAFGEAKEKAEEEIEDAKKRPPDTVLPNNETEPEPSMSYIRQLWNQTYFLSLGDLYTMGKEIYDFIVRQLERRQKDRIGAVGNAALAPFYSQLGAEFKTLQQNAETEQVNRYIDAYKQMGPSDMYERLSLCNNKDELKAIFNVLSDKGGIRWEDKLLWDAINRVSLRYSSSPEFITRYDEEQMRKIIDGFWGGQSYADFKQRNDAAYGGTKSKFQEMARRIENDEQGKGLKKSLSEMLYKHMKGEYVDPATYEGYLHFAIQAGKLNFEDKLYFTFMGMGGFSPERFGKYKGQPLLTAMRVSDIEGQLLNFFPALDYFMAQFPQLDENGKEIWDEKKGEVKKGSLSINNVRKIMRDYIEQDQGKSMSNISSPDELVPGKHFKDFVERELLRNRNVEVRLADKASRDMSNWDHDDWHMFGPQLGESQAEQMTMRTGATQQASIAGLKNALAGFNHFTMVHMDEYLKKHKDGKADEAQENLKRMLNTVRAFVRVNAIIDERYYHKNLTERTRLTTELNENAGVDGSRWVKEHIGEMNLFIGGLIQKLQEIPPEALARTGITNPDYFKGIARSWDMVMSKVGPTNPKGQDVQQEEIKLFGAKLEDAISVAQNAIGENGVAQMISDIQNVGGNNLVRGILAAPKDKKEMEMNNKKKLSLERFTLSDVKEKVAEIERLELRQQMEGRKTAQQIKQEREAELQRVIQDVKAGNYGNITNINTKLLDQRIRELQASQGED